MELVRVVRSGLVESVHVGDVAVCDEDGRLVGWAGDHERPAFARSSMKPLQAAVSLSAIGDRLDARHVAIMCASHNGEPVHIRAVRRLLRVGGLAPDVLRNPPGWPLDAETMARSREPTRLAQNCSGKHAGMLVASACAGWPLDTYRRRGHPLQRRVLRGVRLASGEVDVRVGVDGCGVPVHGLALRAMATLYARLIRPQRLGSLAPFVVRATTAMRAHPYLVAGRKRADTALMQAVDGLIVKSGAEALICAADVASGLGIAVKVADGGERACAPALIDVLRRLGIVDDVQAEALSRFARPWVTGGGERVGELTPVVRLRSRAR